MLRARCLAIGARWAAPDALMGMYTVDEYADAKGVNYTITEDMEVNIIE
jgi:hypothetical protein